MSNLTDFARSELERAGLFDKESDYGGMLGTAVLRLVEVFADEGHSGMSAGMAISLFERLARFEPITPLTGNDDEWNEVDEGVYQNRRCPHVFKEGGAAYNAEGVIFRDPDGCCYTSGESRVAVTFPYVPKTEYRDVIGR